MARRRVFEVRVRVTNVHVYRVELDGTADPELADVDWLAVTEALEPASVEYQDCALLVAREVEPR